MTTYLVMTPPGAHSSTGVRGHRPRPRMGIREDRGEKNTHRPKSPHRVSRRRSRRVAFSDHGRMPPRQRKRAAPTHTSKRRRTDDVSDVDSDSSLSSVPESDDEGPSSRAPRAVASDADLLEQGDNELFQAVLDGSIEEASENWIVLYQGEPAEALTQLRATSRPEPR